MSTRNLRRRSLSLLALTAFAGIAAALPDTDKLSVEVISLAPYGDMTSFSSGALPLTPTTLLVTTRGANKENPADDNLLIVRQVGTFSSINALLIGGFARTTPRWTRLSATQALLWRSGADGTWATGDEQLVIVNRIGSEDSFAAVVVGSLQDTRGGMHVPERLTPRLSVLAVLGDDNEAGTSDDAVAIVAQAEGSFVVTTRPAPFLDATGRTQPVALSPSSFLVASSGPDGKTATADDVLYLFTDVGGANTRTEISLPNLAEDRPGRPVRVSSTVAAVISAGPDGTSKTADDRVYVISDLRATNKVTSFTLTGLANGGSASPRVLGPDLLAISTFGPDGTPSTQDDTVALVSELGERNSVRHITVGGIEQYRAGRPVRLAADRLAVVTVGPDDSDDSADDRIAIVSDIGSTTGERVRFVDVPGLTSGGASEPFAPSASAFVVLSGGADGDLRSGDDDVFTLATDVDTAAPVVTTALAGGVIDYYAQNSNPTGMGGGRAVAMGRSAEGDAIQVIHGLPDADALSVKSLQIKFKASKPQKGAKFAVKADLRLDDPSTFGLGDVTISIGNAAETIPADALVTKRGKPTYKRAKGGTGFIKKLVYNPKKGTLTVTGAGVGTGAERTRAAFIPVTLDIPEALFVGETLTGTTKRSGLKYKRPK